MNLASRPLRVLLMGDDSLPWAIGDDLRQIRTILRSSRDFEVVRWHWQADVIHCVWWNLLLMKRHAWLRLWHRPLVATASNFVAVGDPNYAERENFERLRQHVDLWVAPGTKQQALFQSWQVPSFRLPFLVDTERYNPGVRRLEKRAVAELLRLDWKQLEGRIVIGSFQRDSLGSDLSKPKWQKNPGLLISLLRQMPRDRYILLLAGPRRHYLIAECKAAGIPYLYLGREMKTDDIAVNITPQETMPLLYALTDIYLVTSASEGGPKAILECVASGTPILSTSVGLAEDYLSPQCLPKDSEAYAATLRQIVESGSTETMTSKEGSAKLHAEMSPSAYLESLGKLYGRAIDEC